MIGIKISLSPVLGLSVLSTTTFSIFLFFNSALTISPSSFISNFPTSLLRIYPFGATISLIWYLPIGSLNLFPFFEEINSIFMWLLVSLTPTISILAPSNISPLDMSVLEKSTIPSFISFTISGVYSKIAVMVILNYKKDN